MSVDYCPGCLKENFRGFCTRCRRALFDGTNVSPILPFSRPEYNQYRIQSKGRISISGVQTKHLMKLVGTELQLTEEGGEFILKPIPHGPFESMEYIPVNEHVTMQIAKQIFRLRTAECAIVFFDDRTPAFLTRRFDIMPGGRRLLQEDFAQIAGKSEDRDGKNYKYDLSYEEMAELMERYVSAYSIEIEEFFRRVAFNYLLGNGDAHLKNFSLIRNEQFGDYRLTPAYDLLNTQLHVPGETDMALELFTGGYETESYKVNAKHCYDDFYEFGTKIGIKKIRVERFLSDIVAHREEIIQMLARTLLPDEIRDQYLRLVDNRTERLKYSLSRQ